MENCESKNSREPPVAEYAVCAETETEAKEAAGTGDEAKEAGEVLANIVASTVASDSEGTTRASVSPPFRHKRSLAHENVVEQSFKKRV
ncbi:hypothetical protein GN958_ATG16803 [Phytophthora infestans]|uniref:Uncharacterized protein n=1 Tax=Phytophthora infestans TaxID=4787 RepID=A0A8S9TWT7_PHYIN|nr:hypothetical protein GN958_ATG17609 [Phytophthora infestans]KAF4133996.1 hypothetical protein GN958_ATG16803 [Phytophthora infestans]